MEEFEEIDYKSITQNRKQLERLTSDRYWNEFKGDWKSYLEDAFKYDDEPKSQPKPFTIKVKEKTHPFGKWI
jgi:hypothetical protein